jgi:ribosomal protein S18 acetylase RimI-like enzyme
MIATTSKMVRIRRLAAKDYTAVKKIERIVVEEYLQYLRRTREEDTIEPWITPDYFNHYFRAKTSYVAELGHNIVGFLFSQPTSYLHSAKREIWLEYIAVLPETRRMRIGTALMSKVIDYANRHMISLSYATLNPNNNESIRFLAKHGFEVRDWKQATRKLS